MNNKQLTTAQLLKVGSVSKQSILSTPNCGPVVPVAPVTPPPTIGD